MSILKKIKSFFSKKDSQPLEKKVAEKKDEPIGNTSVSGKNKKTALVFDQTKRIFFTKKKYSTVVLFCPNKKEFHIRQVDGQLQTIRFNPLNDDEFAYPIAGDWTGQGKDGIGIYYPKTGMTFLKNSIDNSNISDISLNYDVKRESIPLAGNWNGKGIDTLCFYYKERSAFIFPDEGSPVSSLRFGGKKENYIPIRGDWNNSGYDSVGIFDPTTSIFKLKYTLEGSKADLTFRFGQKNSEDLFLPLSGHWEGGHSDSVGLYEKTTGILRLKNVASAGKADDIFKIDFLNLIPLTIYID